MLNVAHIPNEKSPQNHEDVFHKRLSTYRSLSWFCLRQVIVVALFQTVCLYCLNLLHVFILANLSFIFQYSCELSCNIGKNAPTSGQPENSGCREDLWSCRRLIVQTINTLGMSKTNISRIFSKGDCHKHFFLTWKKVEVNISISRCLSSQLTVFYKLKIRVHVFRASR